MTSEKEELLEAKRRVKNALLNLSKEISEKAVNDVWNNPNDDEKILKLKSAKKEVGEIERIISVIESEDDPKTFTLADQILLIAIEAAMWRIERK